MQLRLIVLPTEVAAVRRVQMLIEFPDGPVRVPADLTETQLAGTACVVCAAGANLRTGHESSAVPVAFALSGDREVALFAHPGTAPVDVLFAGCIARCEACGEVDATVTAQVRHCSDCRAIEGHTTADPVGVNPASGGAR